MIKLPNSEIYAYESVNKIADQLYSLIDRCSVMTFAGPLGAGKTTLIREILKKIGIKEHITSPTFNYVNIYEHRGVRYYHFDLYRVKSLDFFCEAGFDEYLYRPQSFALIEWPEIIMPLLDHAVCQCAIDYCEQDKRCIAIECR